MYIKNMDTHSDPTSSILEQITDYDKQILTLQNMKAKAREELDKITLPVLEQMNLLKRKFADVTQTDFDRLRELLRREKIIPSQEEKMGMPKQEEQKTEKRHREQEMTEMDEEQKKNQLCDKRHSTDRLEVDPSVKKVVQTRRNVYPEEVKKKLVQYIEEHGYDKVHTETTISVNSLKTIKKAWNKNTGWTKKRGRKIQHPDIDADVVNWVLERRLKGAKITAKRVIAYCRKLAKDKKYDDIKYGWSWFRKFLKRHQLSLRKPSSNNNKPFELLAEGIETFTKEIHELIESGIYARDFIFNLDETSIPTELSREKTIEHKGVKKVKVNTAGKEKECHTVLLGVTMTGKKLPAYIVIKSKGVKLILGTPRNVRVAYREKGSWMDIIQMKHYIRTVLMYWAEDIPPNKRGLLLIDNFKGHIDSEIEGILRKLRIDVKTLPKNTTAYLQPLDLTVNGPFKQYYADYWNQYQLTLDQLPLTKKAQNFQAPSKKEKISWISKAWEEVMESTIIKGFKCYTEILSANTGNSNDDLIEEDYHEDLWKDLLMKGAYTSEDEDSSDDDGDDYGLNLPDFLDYEVFLEPREII
jgi:hypothetical protein